MIRVESGGEYRGEVYISCDSHPTIGWNNGYGRGAIFDEDTRAALAEFLFTHADCSGPADVSTAT